MKEAKEVKTSEQWGNNQAQFVRLGCVKSNLHLSWICQCWQGTLDAEPTHFTEKYYCPIMQPLTCHHCTVCWSLMKCKLPECIPTKFIAFKGQSLSLPILSPTTVWPYITEWWIGREGAKRVWIAKNLNFTPTPWTHVTQHTESMHPAGPKPVGNNSVDQNKIAVNLPSPPLISSDFKFSEYIHISEAIMLFCKEAPKAYTLSPWDRGMNRGVLRVRPWNPATAWWQLVINNLQRHSNSSRIKQAHKL